MIAWQNELDKLFNSNWDKEEFYKEISSEGIVLYGAGSMGKMALDLLKLTNIKPQYIVDKNSNGILDGINVVSPDNIPKEDFERFSFVVCIASIPYQPIKDFLIKLGCKDVRHFYDYSELKLSNFMGNGWISPNPDDEAKQKIISVCKAFEHDSCSISHYLQFLWWRIRRKELIYPEFPVISGEKFFNFKNFPSLTKKEVFLDGGAHQGESIKKFIEKTEGRFEHIWAFEPDKTNFEYLKKNIVNNVSNITLFNKAVYNKCGCSKFQAGLGYASKIIKEGTEDTQMVSMDSLPEIEPTIIKLHIEGSELEALKGAAKTIKKNRPIVMVLADHNKDGLYKIPEFLMEQTDYKLFFNLHDYCGNSAVFYALPSERIN